MLCSFFDFEDECPHIHFRDLLKAKLNEYLCQDFPLNQVHKYVDLNDINSLRLRLFEDINNEDWKSILLHPCSETISLLLGPDLLIQNQLNLSIQMPYDKTSILPVHSDCNSGDSPFELVLWIPLTDSYLTNSMFVLDPQISKQYFESLISDNNFNPTPLESDFVNVLFGQYLVFPPSLLHGNVLNETQHTRVSLNVRVKSVFSPNSPINVPDRRFGGYYEEWTLSPLFKWNSTVYRLLS